MFLKQCQDKARIALIPFGFFLATLLLLLLPLLLCWGVLTQVLCDRHEQLARHAVSSCWCRHACVVGPHATRGLQDRRLLARQAEAGLLSLRRMAVCAVALTPFSCNVVTDGYMHACVQLSSMRWG